MVAREFDLDTLSFVEDGFNLPESKLRIQWIDRNTLYVGADFGEGSLTASGYPPIVKRWRRGTPIDAAETLFEREVEDVAVGSWISRPEGETHFFYRSKTFFYSKRYALHEGQLLKLDVPENCRLYGPPTAATPCSTSSPIGILKA